MKSLAGEDFLISRGAPFFELQRQVGLVGSRALHSRRRAIIFISLTALVPLLLALLAGGAYSPFDLLASPHFLVRFVLFVGVCFLMERAVDERLRDFLVRFARSGLLDEHQLARGAQAVTRALRLRDNAIAEITCALLAAALTAYDTWSKLASGEPGWLVQVGDGGTSVTLTGWWIALVSNPLFWFLVFRWLWRIAVWSLLLVWISQLSLRLVATHPDKSGGIAFIGAYPNSFAPLVFGMSSVVAAGILHQFHNGLEVADYGKLMTIWLALVLLLFMLPLTAFGRPLGQLKAATLREADILSTRIQRKAERGVFGRNLVADDTGETQPGDIPDPSAFRKAAESLRTVPFSRAALVPLGLAALLPLLAVGATQLPFGDLLRAARRLIII